LSLHRIFGSAVEGFDSQMLFDPLEVGIDAPIADLVGMGKGVAGYRSANSQMAELLRG